MVREALGEEAIIVATREIENAVGGAMHQITAAIENDRRDEDDIGASDSWLYADDDDDATVIEEITETMLRHAVPEEILDQVISCAAVLGLDEPRLALMSAIESLFKFSPFPDHPSGTPIMMVGAPGSGKTLATAKLAARYLVDGMDVAVITTDTERAGGREQLEAFTRLMEIDLKTVKSEAALKEALFEYKSKDAVLIDTAGTNPFDRENVKTLARLIGVADMDPVLVLPANTNAEEAGEMGEIFATLGVKRLLPTRVDVARRLGSLLAASYQGGLSFSDISGTAKVVDGLSQLTSKRLTQLLMPRAERAKMQNARKAG